jgi:type I restriction enzyme S subunit
LGVEAATNQACANCIVDPRLTSPQFIFNYLLSQRRELIEAGQGGAQPNLSNAIVREWPLPLPPLAEQRRIVAAVEGVLAKVNAARERLHRVPSILKRFRQAVLTAACSGRLTPNSVFIPVEDNGSKHELCATAGLESLPTGWELPELETIRDDRRGISYGVLKPGPFVQGGIPLLRIVDIESGIASTQEAHRIGTELSEQYNRTLLQGGEVLVSLVGTIGRVAIVPAELRGTNIHRNLALIAPSERIDSRYLAFALSSDWVQKQIAFVTVGASQPLFNLGDLKRLLIPLPPPPEQQEIVRRVGELFALADSIEARLADARQMADQLTQSVLAKAFRGELVPTEAELARREKRSYEPAADLLARIRAEREKATSTPERPARKPRKRSV